MAGYKFVLAALLALSATAFAQDHEDGGALGARICAAADADTWHFPHPTDCNRFIKCDTLNDLSSIVTCPGDLLYNAAASVCDRAENVDCSAAPGPDPEPEPQPEPNTKPPRRTTPKRPAPTTTTTTTKPPRRTTTKRPAPTTTTTKRPSPTAKPPPPATEAPAPQPPPTGDFNALCKRYSPHRYHVPHPSDPSKFYKCEWTSGIAWEFDCPKGLVFKPRIQVCAWPWL